MGMMDKMQDKMQDMRNEHDRKELDELMAKEKTGMLDNEGREKLARLRERMGM